MIQWKTFGSNLPAIDDNCNKLQAIKKIKFFFFFQKKILIFIIFWYIMGKSTPRISKINLVFEKYLVKTILFFLLPATDGNGGQLTSIAGKL